MHFILRKTSLFFKVIFVASLILIFAISFNVWWNTSLHSASIEKLTHEKTKIIAEFIEENVIRAMEKGRHFDMHRILKNYAIYKDVRRIALFSMDGTIRASTQDDELNKKVGDVQFYLKDHHFIREEMVQHKDGKKERERVYYFNTPILNRPECFQCHDKEKKIVGVLTVSNSLKEMDTMISKIEPGGFGTLDELFEALTLVQTKMVPAFPVILAGEDEYWDGLLSWLSPSLLRRGKIGPEDLTLLQRARTPDEVLALVARAR